MDKNLDALKNMVLNYNTDQAEQIARDALSQGTDPLQAAEALTMAIKEVGDRFGAGELFLPDLVCASEVLKKALPVIEKEIEKSGQQQKCLGKVVIGTVYGDIHTIGKGMVATLLFAAGFKVVDLGVNVEAKTFLEAVQKENPDILAMSALLTTTSAQQKKVIEGLVKAKVRDQVKVIVGGSPINQEFAQAIGADGYGATAPEGVKIAKQLLQIKE